MKKLLASFGAAAVLIAASYLAGPGGALGGLGSPAFLPRALLIAAYLAAGYDVLLAAVRRIARGDVFNELFLMSLATVGALIIGYDEEAIGVMAFYKVGEALQEAAYERSVRSVRALMALRPDTARVRRGEAWIEMPPEEAAVGDLFMVKPGERVPLDGRVVEGESFVDSSSVSGESAPRSAGPGSEILSGFVALDGSLTARATRAAADSSAARVIALVEGASRAKARTERFVTRFARVYTPIVVGAAALVAFGPPIAGLGSLSEWAYRALVLLVISCPCALVVSVPLAYFAGIGGAARRGVLIKGGRAMDALARAGTVVLDKTGTLTKGEFSVRAVLPEPGWDEGAVLAFAAAAESRSLHPIAAAIRAEAERRGLSSGSEDEASSIREAPGAGVAAEVGGRRVLAGNDRLFAAEGIGGWTRGGAADATMVRVAVDGKPAGLILAGDEPKVEAARAIRELGELGVRRTVMLTGDAPEPAMRVAEALGIAEAEAGLSPEGKLDILERIVRETSASGWTTVFVGDGVNDAPSLARADAGIAMGAGSDAAVESADAVLLSGDLGLVARAIRRSRATRSIAAQNIALALGTKAVVFGLGIAGEAGMWAAVFADVGVALLAIGNSLRTMR